jgi:organic hydroperoxide reductase OsmC/OhrA
MSEHKATIRWAHTQGDFLKGQYSREHTWAFDGGVTVPASPAPTSVRPPFSNPANVDPEEAYVAAISSCHMLSFLWVAYRAGFEVARYDDDAVGVLRKNERGAEWVAVATLRPRIAWKGAAPAPDVLDRLHHDAHEVCYIANSVKTEIRVEPADA